MTNREDVLCPLLDFRAALTLGEGVGRYARELAFALDGRSDCKLRLFGPTWAPPLEADGRGLAPAGARLFRKKLPSKPLTALLRMTGVPVERLVGGADVVHHTQYRRLPTKCPEVFMLHDLVYFESRAMVRDARVAGRMSRFAIDAARRAKRGIAGTQRCVITTPSEAVADEVATRLDVPRERVFATPLGVDHVHRLPESAEARARARARVPFILTLARIEPRKNHIAILRALEALGSSAPHWVVAGPLGDGAEDFVRAVERSVLRDKIDVLGRVSEADVRALIEACLSFVLVPHDEGFGLAPLEAMALGATSITSDVPVVREVCGGAAELVAPDDVDGLSAAIERAVIERAAADAGNPAADQAAAQARAHAAKFTWARTAERSMLAYRVLFAG